ncbi:MAG: PAS domain S-box protein [Desulfobacterales bacterium]|nr:PAS domain S-box protein [Desulfobacterales bacterium]
MQPDRNPVRRAARVAAAYALVSAAWILFSDQLVAAFTVDPAAMTRLQMVKGWAFVLATGLLIYAMMRREMARLIEVDEAQRASEASFRLVVENSRDIILFLQRDTGRILEANRAATLAYGRSRDELLSLQVMDLREPGTADLVPEQMARADSEGILFETVHRRRDGSTFPVEISSRGATIGGIRTLISVVRDITERRRSEDALRASESRFRTLADSMPQLVWTATPDGRMDYFNRGIEEFRGVVTQPDGSWEWSAMVHPEDLPLTLDAWRHALATGRGHEAEHRLCMRDGSCKWFLSRTTPARDAEGRIVKWYGTSTEIDSRKQAEQRLLDANRRLDCLVTESPAVVYTLGLRPVTSLKFISPNVEKILGWKPERFTENADAWTDCLHPDDVPTVADALARLETTGQAVLEYRFKDSRGRFRWIHDECRLVAGDAGAPEVVGAWWDITETRTAQEELRRLAAAIEQAAEMVVVTDAKADILYANPAFEKITGYRLSEVIGRNPRFLKSGEHDRGFYQRLWAQLSAGTPWQGRFVNRRKDGSRFTEETTISPVFGPSGEVVSYVAVKRDVTREQALEQQYLEAQKMEAIGTLAGGIAHDFNNILAVVMANAQMLEFSGALDAEARETLNQIVTASKRARRLVRQILAFSRRGPQEKVVMNLKPVVKETLGLLRASLPATIRLEHGIATNTGMLFADPTQMQQVLMNLCTNAAHAMESGGGVLRISLADARIEEGSALLEPGLVPGDYVKLSVADTGQGMPPWVLNRIFEPYFTTKEIGKGTGLGLSVAHGIVKAHGGAIKVSSAVQQGTVFDVYLPMVKAEEEEEAGKADLPLVGGTGRVLFVDDEPALTLMGRKILSQLGYTVQTADNPVEALEAVRSNPGGFDLVITDLTMPEMTGTALAEKLLEIRPDLPVVLCTGFSDRVNDDVLKTKGLRGLLLKPLTIQELAHAVRVAIASPKGD